MTPSSPVPSVRVPIAVEEVIHRTGELVGGLPVEQRSQRTGNVGEPDLTDRCHITIQNRSELRPFA